MSKTLRELTLALSTVTGDLYHVSGGDLLDKRITIDDISTAVRSTLKGPLVANGNVTIETGGLLLARANEDVIQEIGRVKVWGASDIAYVSHYDFATAAGAGWQQNASGDVYLNAPTGRTAGIRIANGNILTATGSLITATKDLTISGNITQTSGVISARAGANVVHVFGKTKIGGTSNLAFLTHNDLSHSTLSEVPLSVTSAGRLILNAKTGQEIVFRKNNVQVGEISDTAFDFGMTTLIKGAIDNLTDALQVAGAIYASTSIQAGSTLYAGSLTGTRTQISASLVNIGQGRTADGNAIIDLIGDTTYTDYGFRILRASGENGATTLTHRGTNLFVLKSTENGTISLKGTADYATFSNTVIALLKPTTITGLLTANTGISTTGVMSAGSASITGALACATINTGAGDFEIGQSVLTTSDVTFNNLTLTGNLILTTNPTEDLLGRSSSGTTLIPVGIYAIELEASFTSGLGSITVEVEKLINGTWYSLGSVAATTVGSVKDILGNTTHISSGSDLRISAVFVNTASGTARINYTKY